MKYLVIGDSNSVHIYNFVKTVLLPNEYEVYLITLSVKPIREEYKSFYKENNVRCFSINNKNDDTLIKKNLFKRIINFLKKIYLIRKVPDVDICHVQSVYKTSLLMVLLNKHKFNKLILSYWGGDIENRTSYVVKLRKKCFKYANAITVTVKETYNEFQKIYGEGFNDKLHICRFATDGLNCINRLKDEVSIDDCKKQYDVPKGKYCITCGYSAYREQHQDLILELLNSMDEKYKKQIFVIVPLQYGKLEDGYVQEVKNIAEKCDFQCLILEKFVPFEESVKLAIATDIYIHLRDTDAFSNALKEHVYAKSHIIKGDWLKYPELDEMEASIISIPKYEELIPNITSLMDLIKISNGEIEVFEPIFELYSTQAIKKQWEDVILKVLM